MGGYIKTGEQIVDEWVESPNGIGEYKGETFQGKWLSVDWFKKELMKKRKEYPCGGGDPFTTSSECIENVSAKEVFAWLLTLLEG